MEILKEGDLGKYIKEFEALLNYASGKNFKILHLLRGDKLSVLLTLQDHVIIEKSGKTWEWNSVTESLLIAIMRDLIYGLPYSPGLDDGIDCNIIYILDPNRRRKEIYDELNKSPQGIDLNELDTLEENINEVSSINNIGTSIDFINLDNNECQN